ncbi:MAG: tetraacyldisaccharide 4'-kinase [Gammaproteobacteria bacterium]
MQVAKRLDEHWYGRSPLSLALAPLGWLYCLVAVLRRKAYRLGLRPVCRLSVPVIVVGNITVGGTGKTPLVAWLVRFLKQAGYTPGIISRGYRGNATVWPQAVDAGSDPALVGDEAVLLAQHSECPVMVGPDRAAAARALLERYPCDVIISDDGLQHYRLGRDIEIAVIDGARRLGNGRCLPAGPLREPRGRLRSVDFIVVNGGDAEGGQYAMRLVEQDARNLADAGTVQPVAAFSEVHAVAGIGNPARFFSRLRALGLQITEHPFPDHHAYQPQDLDFGDARPLLMTEKDAVKCHRFAQAHYWYVPVEARLDERFGERLLNLLKRRAHG